MRKSTILPLIALAGGIVGLLVRRLYLSRAFEPGTGLPIHHTSAAWAMWAVVAAIAVAVITLSAGKHRSFEKIFTAAFVPRTVFCQSLRLASVFFFAVAGFLNLESFVSGGGLTGGGRMALVRPVLGIMSLLAAAGIFFMAKTLRSAKPVSGGWTVTPGFVCCFWVMSSYQSWAQDPVLSRYLFSLLAVLLAMVGCYFTAGFAFGKGRVTLTLITCLLSAALSITVLGDALALYDLAMHLATAAYLVSMAMALANNDKRVPPPICTTCDGCPGCTPAAPDEV